MTVAFLALGSNLGDRAGWLRFATESLATLDGLTVEATTEPEETAPLGGLEQPAYLNAMLRGRWTGSADDLLAACHRIETASGRQRTGCWSSRELDIDIVRFGDLLCDGPAVTLPHPGLRDREFWVRQLAELESHG